MDLAPLCYPQRMLTNTVLHEEALRNLSRNKALSAWTYHGKHCMDLHAPDVRKGVANCPLITRSITKFHLLF